MTIDELRQFRRDFDAFYRYDLKTDFKYDIDEEKLYFVDLLLANAVKSLGSPLENIKDSIQM
jgi:hypothetical protein